MTNDIYVLENHANGVYAKTDMQNLTKYVYEMNLWHI